MKTTAKFKCLEVTLFETYHSVKTEKGTYESKQVMANRVKFQVVSSEKPENETFAIYTPYGQLEVVITNPAVIGSFEPGKEYFFDMYPA